MKTNKIYFLMIFMFAAQIFSQDKSTFTPANLYNTKSIQLHSKEVNDDYLINVSLPNDYNESTKSYPVIYVLDGDVAFGMTASIARYLEVGNNIPQLIIVGIGYDALNSDEGNMRRRDYTPTPASIDVVSDGAAAFLRFIKNELVPFINSGFRTIEDDNTINGYSLSGTFALYSLFTEPDLFKRYIIGSPHLSAGNFAIYDYEERAAIRYKELNANVFISVGSEESEEIYFKPIDELVIKLQNRNYTGLNLETKVFDGGTHLICPPEAIAYGLISVFRQ
jgi:uncharacterized protein